MPRLTPVQHEQGIGRLNAKQKPKFVGDALNCNGRSIQRLRRRYNATNSTLDRPSSGCPRVTT